MSKHFEKLSKKFFDRVPPRLSPSTIEQMIKSFAFFDLNANETIEVDELRRIFHAMNVKKSSDECEEILRHFDLNDDGKIDLIEFIFSLARLFRKKSTSIDDEKEKEIL